MAPSSAPSSSESLRSGLAPGSVVGGRFEIERAVREDPLGSVLAAKDQKTQRPIAVRVLGPGIIATPDAIEILRAEIKVAATLQHKNVVATYGMGSDKGGARFVATEWMDGQTLAEAIAEKRRSGGTPMSLRGAHNVLVHVCRALEAAHDKAAAHGALRPSVVWITAAGRVKVGEFGLARAIVRTVGPAALGATEQAFLAPEVKAGGTPTPASDVFGLGGLLYAMLTGRTAADEFAAPSQVHPEATEELDGVLLRCLAANPSERFTSVGELKDALVALTAGTKETEDRTDFGVDVDVDVDIASVRPPAAAALETPRAVAPGPSAKRPVPPPPARPQAAQPPPTRPAQTTAAAAPRTAEPNAPPMSAEVDLSNLLSQITKDDAARWMVVKDGLDHGPFSGRELVQSILKGEVLGDHGLLNMDNGDRRKVKEAPEFAEFVQQYKLKKADLDHRAALERSAKVETASNFAKFAFLLGAIVVVGAGVGIFLVTRPDAEEEQRSDAALEDLYERGEIEISGTAGILPDPPSGGGRRRRAGSAGAAGASYEDAMNEVVNLGNVAEGGGSMSRLTPQQVAGVMNQNVNSLVPCVAREPGVGSVRIDLAIAGSGQVLGASVRNGSPAFQSCIQGRVRRIRFPSFGAPRMGASYTFSAN